MLLDLCSWARAVFWPIEAGLGMETGGDYPVLLLLNICYCRGPLKKETSERQMNLPPTVYSKPYRQLERLAT